MYLTVFEVQPPRSRELSHVDLYLWGTLKIRSVFSCNWKWRNI